MNGLHNLMPQLGPPPMQGPSQPPRGSGDFWLRLIVFVLGIAMIFAAAQMLFDQIEDHYGFGFRGPSTRTLQFGVFAAAVLGVVGLAKLVLPDRRDP